MATHGLALVRPGDENYDAARAAWNRNARHRPLATVMATTTSDVQAAVRYARAERLGVGVMATGHGTAAPCDGGVLVNTSLMRDVRVDARCRTARVAAGARWADVVPVAAACGLAGLPGSSSHVSVTGYTMGGGFGWLGRRFGFAADSLLAAELVLADGTLVRTSAAEHPDLLWGLKGGGGNLGIVTALEFALHPVAQVYAGNLFYPVDRAREVLAAYAAWSATLPDAMASAAAFRLFPPLPTVPERFRGRTFMAVRVCWCGDDLGEGERWTKPLREALGEPEINTAAVMPAAAMDTISMDPVDPLCALSHSAMLRSLSPEVIETLVGLGSPSPLIMLELRQLGGALATPSGALSPMAHTDAPFSLNAIGVTPTPERTAIVRSHLDRVAEEIRPHATGTTYVNFLDLAGATPQRVRAAYSASDWARLVALKERWDPNNVFRFNRNIPPSGR